MFLSQIFFILTALVVLYVSQYYFDQNEFLSFIKVYFTGIIFAIVYRLFFGFFDDITMRAAHPLTLSLIYGLADGLLKTGLAIGLLYIFTSVFGIIETDDSFRTSAFLITGLLCGINTVYGFYYAKNNFIPGSLIAYLIPLSTMILQALITGYSLSELINSYNIPKKIMWGITGLLLPAVIITPVRLLYFYNFIYSYSIVIITGVLFYLYYKKELE